VQSSAGDCSAFWLTQNLTSSVAEAAERHARLQLAETSPADKATVTLATYIEVFLSAAAIEANSKETYARHLTLHVIPYIGKLRVAEVSRETIHRLLSVVLKEEDASQSTILHTRTWSADYARDRKRRRTDRSAREWSPAWRNDPTEYPGADVWRRIWNTAVDDAALPFPYTPYQVRHTHASWLIDRGADLARVQYRLGHGDLQATTRYIKILDEEDPKAADVISAILGDVAQSWRVCRR
jgi:site-specific recombinase XerD